MTLQRNLLPTRRQSYRQRFSIGGQIVYLTTGNYPDGKLGEIFIDASRAGSALRALLSAFAISVSRGLQYGVPLEDYVSAFKEFHFEPSGEVEGDDRIKEAYSILDYIFTELELTYIKKELPTKETADAAAPAYEEEGTGGVEEDAYEVRLNARNAGRALLDHGGQTNGKVV